MTLPNLIFGAGSHGVHVDLERLYESRLLIQGVSGSGKSTAIRSLLEQTHGKVPQFVVDFDGDFVTLREKYDYVLVGPGGDVPISIKTAKITIRRLVELGVSAIFDVSEMKFPERREWVKLACEELVHLPRSLWSTRLFILDEAHIFAPERGTGESVSTSAVIDVITLGRKRGIVTVCATQRLSKFHKDAAAELNNKLIGYTDDVDLAKAGDQLGMTKEQRAQLKLLETHTFYGYGPAISRAPVLTRTLPPATSPPPRGQDRPAAPPARAAVQKVLAQLTNLPKEAEEEARTVQDLQRRNADLERRIRQAEKGGATKEVVKTVVDQVGIDRAVARDRAERRKKQWPVLERLQRGAGGLGNLITAIGDLAKIVNDTTAPEPVASAAARTRPPEREAETRAPTNPVFKRDRETVREAAPRLDSSPSSLGPGERKTLIAIAQYPEGAERDQLSVLTGYKKTSRNSYISRLAIAGLIEVRSDRLFVTDAGVDALGSDYEPLPQGEALQEYWLARLPDGEKKILDRLISAYPDSVDRNSLEDLGYKKTSYNSYISRLNAKRLVDAVGRGEVRASANLFSEALV